MTKEEIKKKIDELERREFLLQMDDHWSSHDYELDRELTKEIRELKEQLRGMK